MGLDRYHMHLRLAVAWNGRLLGLPVGDGLPYKKGANHNLLKYFEEYRSKDEFAAGR